MPTISRRLRLDGYVRVSDVRGRSGPSFISPTVQRERIEAWCDLYNARVGEVFEELDESGRRADRPLLEQALQRIELGLSDGIIVALLSRFADRWPTRPSTSRVSRRQAERLSPSRSSSISRRTTAG